MGLEQQYICKIINNNIFIVSSYESSKRSIGLLNKNNKIVIAPQFDDYYCESKDFHLENFNKSSIDNIDFIDFIEYPILTVNKSKDSVEKSSEYIKYDRYKNIGDVDFIVHRYSTVNYLLIKKFKIDAESNHQNLEYLFLSESDYKYKNFYEKISSFKFDTSNISLSRVNNTLTVKEFNQLKHYYSDYSTMKTLFYQYQIDREKLQLEKEAIAKKERGGCYIATMVYGNYNHPDVLVLRRFRDQKLQLHFLGRIFISKYYKYSPKFVKYVEDKKVLRFFSKITIYFLVKIVKKCGLNSSYVK